MNEVDFDDPSEDPHLQKPDYEAALGCFLVAFNRIENMVSEVIYLALEKSGRKDVYAHLAGDMFNRKVVALELISLRYPEVANIGMIKELRALGSERNNLAHGHFDGNPFDGSFRIVTNKRSLDMPIAKVIRLAAQAEEFAEQYDTVRVGFWFDDLDELPEENSV